jgi:GTP pyrophosphokinase
VEWGEVEQVYPVAIQVDAWDRVGLLRDVSAIVASEGVNITEVNMTNHSDNVTSIYFTVEVKSVAQLSSVISKIYSLWDVINVVRRGEIDVKQQIG